jgi:hypothetical protein
MSLGLRIVSTIVLLAAERGLVNGALAKLSAVDTSARDAFQTQRAKGVGYRNESLDQIAVLSLPEQIMAGALAVKHPTAERLDGMRSAIDQALDGQDSVPPSQAAWFAAATAEVGALTNYAA